MNILITQVSKMGAVCWIKCLKRIKSMQLTLYGIDKYPFGYSAGSQYVDHYYRVPYEFYDAKYTEFLVSFCRKNNVKLILVAVDEELELLIKNNAFKDMLVTPTHKVFSLFHDKYVATKAISKLGIKTPAIITDPFGKKKVIIRDRVGAGSRGIYVIDLEKESYIENRFQADKFMQEYVDGEEYTVDILTNKSGMPIVIVPRRRIEIHQGISFKCKLTKDEEIIDICKRIYKEYNIPGITNIQFIKNNTGVYFVELNPRIGGTTIASVIGGFNLAELFIKHYLFNEDTKDLEYYNSLFTWNSIISRDYTELIYLP